MLADKRSFSMRFSTPPSKFKQNPEYSPARIPASEGKNQKQVSYNRSDYKVPSGDSPYVRAKEVQLVDKDPSRAISLFWAAINSGDRVDSALKDMAVVMKQLDRSDEAIEAVKSFRHLCHPESQESLDNVLMELYKRSGRIDEQIQLLEHKLNNIHIGLAFSGKRTKIARSQGRRIQITIEQEEARFLGNLAWAHLQKSNYGTAEEHYRRALSLEPDRNKQCNLAICLMHMNRISEAKTLIDEVRSSTVDESHGRSLERATQLLTALETSCFPKQEERHNYAPPLSATPQYLSNSFQWEEGTVDGTILLEERGTRSYRSGKNPRTPLTEPRRRSERNHDGYANYCYKSADPNPNWKSRTSSMNYSRDLGDEVESPEVGKKSWADMVEEDEDGMYERRSCSSYEESEGRAGNDVSPRKSTARRSLSFFGTRKSEEEVMYSSSTSKKAPSYGGCSGKNRLSFKKTLHGIAPHV